MSYAAIQFPKTCLGKANYKKGDDGGYSSRLDFCAKGPISLCTTVISGITGGSIVRIVGWD